MANVGDCRAIIGRRVLTRNLLGLTKTHWETVALSDDHDLMSNEQERARLEREHPGEPDIFGYDRRDPRVKGKSGPQSLFGMNGRGGE